MRPGAEAMNRAWILTANGVLLALCCFFTARIVAAGAGGWLAMPPVAGPTASALAPETHPSWEDRQVILTRNLFNVSTLEPGKPVPPVDESYAKTRLPLRLLGTASTSDGDTSSRAAVEETDTHTHVVVRVGDHLKQTAEVVRIDRRRLVLRNAGKLEELGFDETKVSNTPTARRPIRRTAGRTARLGARRQIARRSPSPTVPMPRIQRLAPNRFAVQRSDLNAMAGNPAALFSQARIVPKMQAGGGMAGLQLNAIQPGSVFAQIGIQDGDTITEFNGISLDSPSKSAEVYRQLAQAEQFNVTVRGPDGKQRDLRAEIR